VNAHNSA